MLFILPMWEEDGRVLAGVASPSAITSLDDLRVLFGKPVHAVLVRRRHHPDDITKSGDRQSAR